MCEFKTSYDLATDGPIFAIWYQKMRKTWKKKVTKRCVAICGSREAVAEGVNFGQIAPPPPQLR